METTKVCNTCHRELPATAQYFYHFKYSKDGFKSSCKECQGGNFIVKEKPPEGYRKCYDCGKVLPETEEYFLKYWSAKNNRYYFKCHCLECGKIRSRKWREEKSDLYKAYYMERIRNGKSNEYNKKWRHANPDKVKAMKERARSKPGYKEKEHAYYQSRRATPEGREHCNAMTRRWKQNNKDANRAYQRKYMQEHKDYFIRAAHKRNALKKSLPCTLTLDEWEGAKKEFDYSCAYCGKPLKRLTQDHFIPLTLGGGYTKGNIIPACKRCNCSKHNTPFEEWYIKQEYYSKERETHILDYLNQAKGEKQMENIIKVLAIRTGHDPCLVHIHNTFDAMEKFVGGPIKAFDLTDNITLVCNEEGKLRDLKPSCMIWQGDYNDKVVGDCFLCGVDGDEFTDFPENADLIVEKMTQIELPKVKFGW